MNKTVFIFFYAIPNGFWCWNKPQSRFEYEWRRYNWPFLYWIAIAGDWFFMYITFFTLIIRYCCGAIFYRATLQRSDLNRLVERSLGHQKLIGRHTLFSYRSKKFIGFPEISYAINRRSCMYVQHHDIRPIHLRAAYHLYVLHIAQCLKSIQQHAIGVLLLWR